MDTRIRSSRLLAAFSLVALVLALALPALGGGRPLTADLSPDNEVPPATGSGASGTAWLTLNQGQEEICVTVESGGFATAVLAAHIHIGEAGTNGGVVVDLQMSSGNHSACLDVAKELVKQIRQNPSGYYINVHTVEFPGGEIRGQLSK